MSGMGEGSEAERLHAQAEHYRRNADNLERIATEQGIYHVEVMELVARQRAEAEVAEFMAQVAAHEEPM